MNPIGYFFGSISGTFDSHLTDSSAEIFKESVRKAKNPVQIFIHRRDNLIYYCYLRRLNEKSAFGIGLCYDRIFTNISGLFNLFDIIYTDIVKEGAILHLDEKFHINWTLKKLSSESAIIGEHLRNLNESIAPKRGRKLISEELPAVNFAISKNDCIELSLDQENFSIRDAVANYCNVYIVKRSAEIERLTSFNNLLRVKDKEIRNLRNMLEAEKETVSKTKTANLRLKARQRNTIWIGILGIVSVAMAVVLYFKVINPSEVTRYKTSEFVYYGPIKDKEPHGVGVAIYPDDDPQGRKYYIGNFDNGQRQDSTAILFYANGNYFYGKMTDDNWENGIFYRQSDGTYYKGTFKDNNAYDGKWFGHIELQTIVRGIRQNN